MSRVTVLVLVLLAAVAAAANHDSISPGKEPAQPIEIKSRKLTAKSLPGGVELTFDGEVELKQEDVALSCDRLVVVYEEEKKNSSQPQNPGTKNPKDIASSIKSALGSGNVRIVKNELTAVAEKAFFDSTKRTLTLAEGSPRVSQGTHVLSAPTITIYLDENRAELLGEVKGQLDPGAQKAGSSQPIDITSNKLIAKGIAHGVELTFDGRVRVRQGDMNANCDKMVVLFEEEKKPRIDPETPGKKNQKDFANSIKSAVGLGNVKIAKNDLTAIAGKAVFDSTKKTVTLAEGPPRVWQGLHVLSAPTITVFLDENRAELLGEVKGQLNPASQKTGSNQPIDITSHRLLAKGVGDGLELVFDRKVKVKQEDMTLSCDKMVVLYEDGKKTKTEIDNPVEKNSKSISSSIKSVVGSGDVKIVKNELTAVAGKAVLDNTRRTITLTEGPPRVWQGPHMLSAPTINIYLDESRAEMLGGKNDKNGVTATLNPEKQKKEK